MLVKVQTTDTLTIHDTLYISLPREQKEYCGEDYRVWVSGYRPQLDSLNVYPQQQIITNTVTYPKPKRKRWGIGLQVGYGATIQWQCSPNKSIHRSRHQLQYTDLLTEAHSVSFTQAFIVKVDACFIFPTRRHHCRATTKRGGWAVRGAPGKGPPPALPRGSKFIKKIAEDFRKFRIFAYGNNDL